MTLALEEKKCTLVPIMHRPFEEISDNGWGSAYYAILKRLYLGGKIYKSRVMSAPKKGANKIDKHVDYRTVDCPATISDASKALVSDVFLWDLIHLIRKRGEQPLVSTWFEAKNDQYREGFKAFYRNSLSTAISALIENMNTINPVFLLNDPHDCFVSAFFAGVYDREFIEDVLGDLLYDESGRNYLDIFEEVKTKFLGAHQEIDHMRFWHVPSIDIESFDHWFALDPKMAIHFLASVFSSPLNVHSNLWKKEFDVLFEKYKDYIVELIPNATIELIDNGVGVGPIGYDPSSFLERFTDFKPGGNDEITLKFLDEITKQFNHATGDENMIIVGITFRADDTKNNGIETAKAIQAVIDQNPEIAKRICVMAVYNSSRVNEDPLYKENLDGFRSQMAKIADRIGHERLSMVEKLPAFQENENMRTAKQDLIDLVGEENAKSFTLLSNSTSNLPYQSAMFMASQGSICGARGGFDVVAIEAMMVAALRASGDLALKFSKVLKANGICENTFALAVANTAGSALYIRSFFENFTLAQSDDQRMPTFDKIACALAESLNTIIDGRAKVGADNTVIDDVRKVCNAEEFIEQSVAAAIYGNPQNHERTIRSIEMTDINFTLAR